MKNFIAILGLALMMTLPVGAATNPFEGKIVALDAGHGGGETGAVGVCNGAEVIEADVNWAVRVELEKLLPVGS